MTTSLELTRPPERHAHRVLDVIRGAFQPETSEVVTRSWSRCFNDYRLHPDQLREPKVVARNALDTRRERLADLIDCARYEMTTLYQQLADPELAVVLADTDGVIVHMVSSTEFSNDAAALGLRVGGVWSETEAGTNGMGTCLAAATPVAVRRDEHFFTHFTQLTCSAVPVFDPSGEMCAVLDVTSRSGLMQQHLLVLLGMTARMIENRLIDQRFRDAHPLHFHARPEFVFTLHEGRLAIAEDGSILAANRSALFQLGLQSVDDIRARRLEDIFQTSLDDMLRRSSAAAFHPVVTYRAHAAHRFFAVARQPAAEGKAKAALIGRSDPSPAASTRSASTPSVAASGFRDARLCAHLDTACRVIARRTPILLCGETGSGKEVFARAVHERSPHAGGQLVAINCASLPESLIESELFGYRAGAFTGAQRSGRRGKILQADGGTLFLDEIGDMALDLQARLLRVLDERQVTPLGSEESQTVDFQLISASHRHLPDLVAAGRFREDLYYRLAGIELQLPPLRERGDKRELIRSVLAEEGGAEAELSPAAEQLLMNHAWPGNVRQLRHVLRTATALADANLIEPAHLPSLPATPPGAMAIVLPAIAAASADEPTAMPPAPRLNAIQANERHVLLQLLEQHRWNVSNVAKSLDVSRNTLYRKLHKLHIAISHAT